MGSVGQYRVRATKYGVQGAIERAVILAGGRGTRIAEETHLRPKPMVEIGGQPILWHIMKTYARHGISDFIICLGYKPRFPAYKFHFALPHVS